MFNKRKKELELLSTNASEYTWDELEELITDDFDEERITQEEYENLMTVLMGIEPE